MLTVRVTRPDELTLIRAPLTPALMPTDFAETRIRTPGATLIDLLNRNPMAQPLDLTCVFQEAYRSPSRRLECACGVASNAKLLGASTSGPRLLCITSLRSTARAYLAMIECLECNTCRMSKFQLRRILSGCFRKCFGSVQLLTLVPSRKLPFGPWQSAVGRELPAPNSTSAVLLGHQGDLQRGGRRRVPKLQAQGQTP